jgi:hypothetical protein
MRQGMHGRILKTRFASRLSDRSVKPVCPCRQQTLRMRILHGDIRCVERVRHRGYSCLSCGNGNRFRATGLIRHLGLMRHLMPETNGYAVVDNKGIAESALNRIKV